MKRSLEVLDRRGLASASSSAGYRGAHSPNCRRKPNALRARIRSGIEHVFAAQKHRMALFVRTIGTACAQAKIGMANLAYNFTRLA